MIIKKFERYSCSLKSNGKTKTIAKVYNAILDNETVDITQRVINAFYYQENKSNQQALPKDKYIQKLLPFYDQMIENAVNRLYGSNSIRTNLPQHPQKVIKEFNSKSNNNHFYAFKISSLLGYLMPKYWMYMQKLCWIASGRLVYDLYQIPLNSSSTLNYFVFRGNSQLSNKRRFNRFLFGGSVHDQQLLGVKHFIKWANQYVAKFPLNKALKKKWIKLDPAEVKK